MNRIILSFILIFPLLTVAQAPEKINFQSIIRDKDGVIWSNKSVALKIGILEGGANGTISYLESHNKTTDFSGLLSLQIGTGNILSGSFHYQVFHTLFLPMWQIQPYMKKRRLTLFLT